MNTKMVSIHAEEYFEGWVADALAKAKHTGQHVVCSSLRCANTISAPTKASKHAWLCTKTSLLKSTNCLVTSPNLEQLIPQSEVNGNDK